MKWIRILIFSLVGGMLLYILEESLVRPRVEEWLASRERAELEAKKTTTKDQQK